MLEENGFRNNTIISSVYVANENPLNRSLVERSYFVNNNFKTNTHFDYRSWFRPFVTQKQQQENEVKNVYYNFKVDIFLFFLFNTNKSNTLHFHGWIFSVAIYSTQRLYLLIFFTQLSDNTSKYIFKLSIPECSGVLPNTFSKTVLIKQ